MSLRVIDSDLAASPACRSGLAANNRILPRYSGEISMITRFSHISWKRTDLINQINPGVTNNDFILNFICRLGNLKLLVAPGLATSKTHYIKVEGTVTFAIVSSPVKFMSTPFFDDQ